MICEPLGVEEVVYSSSSTTTLGLLLLLLMAAHDAADAAVVILVVVVLALGRGCHEKQTEKGDYLPLHQLSISSLRLKLAPARAHSILLNAQHREVFFKNGPPNASKHVQAPKDWQDHRFHSWFKWPW